MNRSRVLILLGVVLLLLIGAAGGAWYYLYAPNQLDSAELVPGDTIFFASIPNAATIATGYQTSQLKQLIDSPNSQPVSDSVVKWVGQKNIDVLNTFLPNLSGQSFFAVTHFDANHPEQIGIIAAMKPKPGLGNFDAFVDKLKTTWPDLLKDGTTGAGNVEGVDYQWIKGPGSSDKICVAQVKGWIVTTWGEATLQDWLQRFHKKSITPSLAQNDDYKKTVAKVGKDSMTLFYIDYHSLLTMMQQQMAKAGSVQGQYMMKKFGSLGSLAVGSRFENGEIVDRYSMEMPHQAQVDAGMSATPCPFDTLKFTGPNTRLYWASSIDWKQYWKTLTDQAAQTATDPNPVVSGMVNNLQQLATSLGIDLQKNIIDPLGSEVSFQMEWNDDTTYPEVGIFLSVAKPDDFKPTITSLMALAQKVYAQQAVVNELKSGDQTFAALKFVQSSPVTVTITETGPYFGVFTSENLAVRSFARDATVTLPHDANFIRQIGDKRNGASQIAFVDTPHLLDRTYKTALPYVSLLSMASKELAAFLQGKNLPNDLSWLAPMGTWSYVVTSDDQGIQAYSVSGIGNQGILFAFTSAAGISAAQTLGIIPKMPGMGAPAAPAPIASPAPTPTSTPAPDATTNAAPSSAPDAAAAAPAPSTAPDATPAPAVTNAPTSSAPDAPKPQ
jgi:hypothetical protein